MAFTGHPERAHPVAGAALMRRTAVLVLAAALGACGGGGDAPATTGVAGAPVGVVAGCDGSEVGVGMRSRSGDNSPWMMVASWT